MKAKVLPAAPEGMRFPVKRHWRRQKRQLVAPGSLSRDGSVFYVATVSAMHGSARVNVNYVISPAVRPGSTRKQYVLSCPPGNQADLSVWSSLRKAQTAAEMHIAGYEPFLRMGNEVKPVRRGR